MQRSHAIILLFLGLASVQGVLLVIALRTGRAWGRYGTISREGQPRRFRNYVNYAYVVLLLCGGVILWALDIAYLPAKVIGEAEPIFPGPALDGGLPSAMAGTP